MDLKIIVILLLTLRCVQGQFFEDRRCRCVCPNPAAVLNTTSSRQIFTGNVPPRLCHCEGVVFPLLRAELEGKLHIFCPRCECIYQTRNTSLIMNCSLIHDTTSSSTLLAACQFDMIRLLITIDVVSCAIVFFILVGIAISVMYMMTFSGLKMCTLRGRNYHNADRYLERPLERDYIREHRGEFQREQLRQRELEQQVRAQELRQRELELEHRMEQQRNREREFKRHRNRAVRDGSPGSEEEGLLRAETPEF